MLCSHLTIKSILVRPFLSLWKLCVPKSLFFFGILSKNYSVPFSWTKKRIWSLSSSYLLGTYLCARHWTRPQKWLISIRALARNTPVVRKRKSTDFNMPRSQIQCNEPWKLLKVTRNPIYKHPSKYTSISY